MPLDNVPTWIRKLDDDDLAFIRRFLLASGSLKEMASKYGVTYPTVRLRLDRLIEKIKDDENDAADPYIGLVTELTQNNELDRGISALLISQYKKAKIKEDSSSNHYRIIRREKEEYLGIGKMFRYENAPSDYVAMFNDRKRDGTVNRLKALTKTNEVTALFCYECDLRTNMVSYHIACKNTALAQPGEFRRLTMEPATYAVFNYTGAKPPSLPEASNLVVSDFWEKWLPESDYDCLLAPDQKRTVKGYAALELYSTEDFNADQYSFELWMPVVRKNEKSGV